MHSHLLAPSRRQFLKSLSAGFGYSAFAGFSTLQAQQAMAAANPLAPKPSHFPATAKRVIFLCMEGGPSHLDTFDYKPRLNQDSRNIAGLGGSAKWMGSPFEFKRHGQSGLPISELYPHLAKHADNLCLINGMHTDVPNHPQAFAQLHTGSFQFVRPSLGAWSLYGLGTENQNLPGFITLSPPTGASNYGSAFLPAIYQGTPIGSSLRQPSGNCANVSIPNIKNPKLSTSKQRLQLDFVKSLNQEKLGKEPHNPEVEGVIESFELAFRMQTEIPELLDIDSESQATKALYGIDNDITANFGRQCLLARRFAEAGVRFIEITHGSWDQHRNLEQALRNNTAATDQPIAALLTDLKQRDLLKDTLVIWSVEFGRTPYAQGDDGRDHNNKGFTSWMAGGGVKGGIRYGATDEHGYQAVENKTHIHDLHATMLHLMGLDHKKLTYNHAGRDFRLTDVHGTVVREIIA
ncbi:DUF1501 domain-containing protein [Luteolibacter algae]|uniref:DUF1501 domain-containing protein n=1 Tax=Luteolibacter algae TaxID=454151 RepID=A0ABW5D6Z2_9BACT